MRLAITSGEPAGIGPEICALAIKELLANTETVSLVSDLLVIGDQALLYEAGLPKEVAVHHIPVATPVIPGKLDVANADYVLKTLDQAIAFIRQGTVSAIVTAPVHKGILNLSGVHFTGHTEYFQQQAGVKRVVMLLVADGLRVALATTHMPLRAVPDAITSSLLTTTLETMHQGMQQLFGIETPYIAVCGLNPHAGEGGYLGDEEISIIQPAIAAAQKQGIRAAGPFAADTLFVPSHVAAYDAVLAMYHDQGLPVLKRAGFGHGVNVTLGLPYIRTSVDHGTALDIAATGKADPASMIAAIKLAAKMLNCSYQKLRLSAENIPFVPEGTGFASED